MSTFLWPLVLNTSSMSLYFLFYYSSIYPVSFGRQYYASVILGTTLCWARGETGTTTIFILSWRWLFAFSYHYYIHCQLLVAVFMLLCIYSSKCPHLAMKNWSSICTVNTLISYWTILCLPAARIWECHSEDQALLVIPTHQCEGPSVWIPRGEPTSARH